MTAPTENKVWAATIGSGAGLTVSAFINWCLGVGLWHASSTAQKATEAVAAVPGPVAGIIGLGLTVGGAFAAGWYAKHTPRPAPEPPTDNPEPTRPADDAPTVVAPVAPVEPDPPPVA